MWPQRTRNVGYIGGSSSAFSRCVEEDGLYVMFADVPEIEIFLFNIFVTLNKIRGLTYIKQRVYFPESATRGESNTRKSASGIKRISPVGPKLERC